MPDLMLVFGFAGADKCRKGHSPHERLPMQSRMLFLSAAVVCVLFATGVSGTEGARAQQASGAMSRTIAHDFLELEKDFGSTASHSAYVDSLLGKAAARITARAEYSSEEAVAVLKGIDSLLRDEGFHFKNNYLLGRGIASREVDCDNYSALYVAIAERVKLPLVPVYAPDHSFVRFLFPDGTYLNWEPIKGISIPDKYYIQQLKIPQSCVRSGVYMKNLSRREFFGVQYNNIGSFLLTAKKYSDAVPYFTMAITLYPKFSSARHNRGTALYAQKRVDEAEQDLRAAVELDPSRPSSHNTLADIYFDKKSYDLAVAHYTKSIRLDPTFYVPYHNIGLIMKLQGREDMAEKWLAKSREIRARFPR